MLLLSNVVFTVANISVISYCSIVCSDQLNIYYSQLSCIVNPKVLRGVATLFRDSVVYIACALTLSVLFQKTFLAYDFISRVYLNSARQGESKNANFSFWYPCFDLPANSTLPGPSGKALTSDITNAYPNYIITTSFVS